MTSNPRMGQVLAMDANSVCVKDIDYTLLIDDKSYWIVVDISTFSEDVWIELQMVHPDILDQKRYSQTNLYYLLPDDFLFSTIKFKLV
jgi:hypothetical protein